MTRLRLAFRLALVGLFCPDHALLMIDDYRRAECDRQVARAAHLATRSQQP